VEESLMDSSSRKRASTQRAICEEIFGEKTYCSDGTSTVFFGPSTVRLIHLTKIKSALKGNRFGSVDAVKDKATQLLNSIIQDDLQHCTNSGKLSMERCRNQGGATLNGIRRQLIIFPLRISA